MGPFLSFLSASLNAGVLERANSAVGPVDGGGTREDGGRPMRQNEIAQRLVRIRDVWMRDPIVSPGSRAESVDTRKCRMTGCVEKPRESHVQITEMPDDGNATCR